MSCYSSAADPSSSASSYCYGGGCVPGERGGECVKSGVGVGSVGWGLSLSKCHTAAAGCQNWHCHDVTFVKLITFSWI